MFIWSFRLCLSFCLPSFFPNLFFFQLFLLNFYLLHYSVSNLSFTVDLNLSLLTPRFNCQQKSRYFISFCTFLSVYLLLFTQCLLVFLLPLFPLLHSFFCISPNLSLNRFSHPSYSLIFSLLSFSLLLVLFKHTHTHTHTPVSLYPFLLPLFFTHFLLYACPFVWVCLCVCTCVHEHVHTHIRGCVYTLTRMGERGW